jgi:hypothetical protein
VVHGRITQISPVAQSGTGSGSSSAGSSTAGSSATPTATIPVTVSLSSHQRLRGLDQAAVSVNFRQREIRHALSVPVTALLARPGGGYAVQEATPPQRLVPVRLGLFAAGYVQIHGSGIRPGLRVTNSQG